MHDLLALSSRIIDSGDTDQPVNRVTNELSEVADGIALVESFSHCTAVATDDGMICFDASGAFTGAAVREALRHWSPDRVGWLVYTHGHADHVGGSPHFAADRPTVVGHEAIAARFERYERTAGWNLAVNARQFGGASGQVRLDVGDGPGLGVAPGAHRFLPAGVLRPDRIVDTTDTLDVGGVRIDLHHARGETDDHLWAWLPERRTLVTGDFLIWNFPNAGNPQKVQRYPADWAAALRAMAAMDAELLLPAHGLPISGRDRIARVLGDVADALENLVDAVLTMMNAGATLDEVVHTVRVPGDTLALPYLRPLYDEPEFVVRNLWRLYGGWWDGAASRLKPSPDRHLAAAIAELAGGADVLAARAGRAARDGDLRLACHFADLAAWAAGDDPGVHRVRAEIYHQRRRAETSLMSKGIFGAAARESRHVADSTTE